MSTVPSWLVRGSNEDGASAVEYGLLVAGIAGLVVAMVFAFGGAVSDLFAGTCDAIDSAASSNAVPVSC